MSVLKPVVSVHNALYEPIADLVTYRAFPTGSLPMNALDPFIFLNHHGWQEYPPRNQGLPFGPHPHRGFETVTFILEGDLMHQDSSGGRSVISAGGVQWMTAGSGLIHAEISSDEFKARGGPLEILQLWVNLPARLKMAPPAYKGLQKDEIPELLLDGGRVKIYPLFGRWESADAPLKAQTDIHLARITCVAGGSHRFSIPAGNQVFFYVVRGSLNVNGTEVKMHQVLKFGLEAGDLDLKADTDATLLLGFASPYREPFVAHGPFVMNTHDEILQAYEDFRKGKFGDESAFE